MDEITYWIYTKRAPCLMAYDRSLNNQRSKSNAIVKPPPKPCPVTTEKKRKRKLSILDDESDAAEKKQNVYFEDNQQVKRPVLGSCKTLSDSDVDFNIKNSPKPPKTNLLKNGKVPKKKLITSTPNTKAGVRRSSRKLRTSINNESLMKETLNGFNGDDTKQTKGTPKAGDIQGCPGSVNCNREDKVNAEVRPNERVTLQFEDMSDVSGFTANYIRSTKVHANRTRGNMKNKRNRLLLKETKDISSPVGNTDIVNNTLSGNTELDNTGLSETVNNNTSHNDTADARTARNRNSNNKKRQTPKTNPNISMTTVNSRTSRYPIRNKKIKLNDSSDMLDKDSLNVRGVSRTRSGRYIGRKCVDSESPVKMNTSQGRTKSSWVKTVDCSKKVINNKSIQSMKKDSLRSKSGFAFSDSDEDCQPLKQGKFFDV